MLVSLDWGVREPFGCTIGFSSGDSLHLSALRHSDPSKSLSVSDSVDRGSAYCMVPSCVSCACERGSPAHRHLCEKKRLCATGSQSQSLPWRPGSVELEQLSIFTLPSHSFLTFNIYTFQIQGDFLCPIYLLSFWSSLPVYGYCWQEIMLTRHHDDTAIFFYFSPLHR